MSTNQIDDTSINKDAIESLELKFGLTSFNLSDNKIKNISFIRNLTKLVDLKLSGNNIESISYDQVGNLFGRLKLLKNADLRVET